MDKLLKKLLEFERELLHESRATGGWKIRPSSIILVLFAIFYIIAGIDLFPESIVRPKILGYIDDLIIFIAVASYTYKDWSDIDAIQLGGVSGERTNRKAKVPMGDGHEDADDYGSGSDSGSDSAPTRPTKNPNGSVHTTLGSLIDSTGDSDADREVLEDDATDRNDSGSSEGAGEVRELTPEERRARREERKRARAARNSETSTSESDSGSPTDVSSGIDI